MPFIFHSDNLIKKICLSFVKDCFIAELLPGSQKGQQTCKGQNKKPFAFDKAKGLITKKDCQNFALIHNYELIYSVN